MARTKRKNLQRDFFVLDMANVSPKDDVLSMEHPIFSLSTRPDTRKRIYENNGKTLEVIPCEEGLATIHDKDVLIWAMSKVVHAKNRGLPYSKEVIGSAHDLLSATNRPTSKLGYERLKAAFIRLRGTTFVTNIPFPNGKIDTSVFGMVDSAGFRYDSNSERLSDVKIVLSDWLFLAIENSEILSISEEYFELRRPLERRLYEIGRKHCGHSMKWEIDLVKLQSKTGSNAPSKKFRHNIRQIIDHDDLPTYKMELTIEDKVIFRPRTRKKQAQKDIILPAWAEEKGRAIAVAKGWDYQALLHEWQEFAKSGTPPKDAGAAFVGFCKKKESLRK